MAQIHKLEVEHEAKSSADKLYGMLTHNAPQLSNYIPQSIRSVQVLGNENENGNEITLGTVFVWDYTDDGNTWVTTKERITSVDNKNRSITYTVFEGDLTIDFKSFASTLTITPKDDGSLVKWSVEYQKENADVPTPTAFMKLLEIMSKELDVGLLKQT